MKPERKPSDICRCRHARSRHIHMVLKGRAWDGACLACACCNFKQRPYCRHVGEDVAVVVAKIVQECWVGSRFYQDARLTFAESWNELPDGVHAEDVIAVAIQEAFERAGLA